MPWVDGLREVCLHCRSTEHLGLSLSSLTAKPNWERWSECCGDFGRHVCRYLSTAAFQSTRTAVNIHGKEDEKALEEGARGRVPRKPQHVLSCACSRERKARSPSAAALCYRLHSQIVFLPAAPNAKPKALVGRSANLRQLSLKQRLFTQ